MQEIIIDDTCYFDFYKMSILFEFNEYNIRYNSPVESFLNEKLPEIKDFYKKNNSNYLTRNKVPKFDVLFYETKGNNHIISLIAEKHAIKDFLNFDLYNENKNIRGIDENEESNFDLIKLNKANEQIDKIIKLIHEKLNRTYIDIDFKHFERHFKENGEEKIKINWIDKQGSLKGFGDKLFSLKKTSNIGVNIWISDHFYSENFKVTPESLKSATSREAFLDILNKKPSNKIVELFDEIKNNYLQE